VVQVCLSKSRHAFCMNTPRRRHAGRVFSASTPQRGRDFGPPFGRGDVVGCGVDFSRCGGTGDEPCSCDKAWMLWWWIL
jgi:hypothetical protein